jgi:hypothetical protein
MSLFNDYMDSIDPLHAKALQEVAACRGVLFVASELLPEDVRDEIWRGVKEANRKNEDSSNQS